MKLVRMMGVAAVAAALIGGVAVAPAGAQQQNGGNNRGAPGCIQGNAPGQNNQRGGGQAQAGEQVLTGLINAAIQDVQASALNNLNLQGLNLQVVCLNDVLNANQLQIANVLSSNSILNQSLNGNTVLTNFLNGSNLLNGVQVLGVDLTTGNVYVFRP